MSLMGGDTAGGGINFGGFGQLGGAIGSLFGAAGDSAEAGSYTQAAQIAEQQAEVAKQATAIQETQAQRQIFQVIGGQEAQVAGAGLASSGSAQALLRSSASQGALQKQLIQQQGDITEAGYEAEAASYNGMASAAKSASSGGMFGGLLSGIGALASIF